MAGLTSEETLKEVQLLVDMCFQGNAVLDCIVYAMNTYLNTPKLYEFTHYTLSHALPTVFADNITDFMMSRNDRIYRGALKGSNKFYNDIFECFEDILEVYTDINNQLSVCINSAIDNDDKPVEDFLRGFLVNVGTPYWKQVKVLLDAINQYKEEGILASFNKDYKSYLIIKPLT